MWDYQRLQQWTADGYFAVPGLISDRLIDSMMNDLDGLWTADKPHAGLHVEGLRLGPEEPGARVSHADVCAMAPPVREAARDRSNWRIHGLPRFSDSARLIFVNPELRRLASLIFARPADPGYAINFMYGSTQTEHVFPPRAADEWRVAM